MVYGLSNPTHFFSHNFLVSLSLFLLSRDALSFSISRDLHHRSRHRSTLLGHCFWVIDRNTSTHLPCESNSIFFSIWLYGSLILLIWDQFWSKFFWVWKWLSWKDCLIVWFIYLYWCTFVLLEWWLKLFMFSIRVSLWCFDCRMSFECCSFSDLHYQGDQTLSITTTLPPAL